MFRRKLTKREALRYLEEATMRRALYKQLWEEAHPNSKLPCPDLSDEEIKTRLRKLFQ